MALLLAPYNDSMRLGMGFNSYTQTLCVDNAVKVNRKEIIRTENPSQIVTYSSKIVESLGEVVGSMNISYSTSIRKGTVETAGSSNSIQEDKIKQSDMNAVVSVKVVNQTTIITEDSVFQPLVGVVPGSKDFDDAFGDSYISGFIEGGDFNGIISIKVLDRTKVSSVASAIKKSLSSGSGKDFSLDMDTFSSGMAGSSALKDTETTISVSWMGGGQIKDPQVQWDIDSIFVAAAAFPSQVAKCPQRTWAILTKYRANRSFQEKLSRVSFSPLEYDAVASYTVELFENFMEYKQLMKIVQDIMTNPASYLPQMNKHNAISLEIRTLVAVKTALRHEMSKIVQAVGVLAEDPHSLKRNTRAENPSNDAIVNQILLEALVSDPLPELGSSKSATKSDNKPVSAGPINSSAVDATAVATSTNTKAQNNTITGTVPSANPPESSKQLVDGLSSTPNGAAAANPSLAVPPGTITKADARRQVDYDFSKLIAPEVWKDLLPTSKTDKVLDAATATRMPDSMAAPWAHPPLDDTVLSLTKAASPKVTLTILAAACRLTDITDQLRQLVTDNQQLRFTGQQLHEFTTNHGIYKTQVPIPSQVGILYQYTDQPIRLKMVKNANGADRDQFIQIDAKSTDTVVKPSPWNVDTWSITAVTYGGYCYNEYPRIMDAVNSELRTMSNGVPNRSVLFGDDKFRDTLQPDYIKLGMIFYQAREGGRTRIAVGIQDKLPAVMTDDLATNFVADQITITDLKKNFANAEIKIGELKKGQTESQQTIEAKEKEITGLKKGDTTSQQTITDQNEKLTALNKSDTEKTTLIDSLKSSIARLENKGVAQHGIVDSTLLPVESDSMDWRRRKMITFGTYPRVPIFLYGLQIVGWSNKSTGCTFGFDAVPMSISNWNARVVPWYYNATDIYLRMSWMTIPSTIEYNFQNGYIQSGPENNPNPETKSSRTFEVWFSTIFELPPKCTCWLVSVDQRKHSSNRYGMEAKIESVNQWGLKIRVEAASGLGFEGVKVGWAAWDAKEDGKRVKMKQMTLDSTTKDVLIDYLGEKEFTKKPAMFCVIRQFAFDAYKSIFMDCSLSESRADTRSVPLFLATSESQRPQYTIVFLAVEP